MFTRTPFASRRGGRVALATLAAVGGFFAASSVTSAIDSEPVQLEPNEMPPTLSADLAGNLTERQLAFTEKLGEANGGFRAGVQLPVALDDTGVAFRLESDATTCVVSTDGANGVVSMCRPAKLAEDEGMMLSVTRSGAAATELLAIAPDGVSNIVDDRGNEVGERVDDVIYTPDGTFETGSTESISFADVDHEPLIGSTMRIDVDPTDR